MGPRNSLVLFNLIAVAGYAVVALAGSWTVVLLALPLVMAWQSFSLPATFALVGDALPAGARSMGFALQSIVRRIPIVVAPIAGGLLIARYGIGTGMRTALLCSMLLGLAALTVQLAFYRSPAQARGPSLRESLRGATQLDERLKVLLLCDVIVRFGQGLGEVFVVLYAVHVLGASPAQFGWLIGVAMATSIGIYVPVARIADARGRTPWVVATYLCFAAFPCALALTLDARWLPVAFVIMGLREIGEPPRKALIVDWARAGRRSVDVGAYYFVRGLAVFPASFAGGLLWRISPQLTFLTAAGCALLGSALFYCLLGRKST